MKLIKIQCEDAALSEELVAHLLAFAQNRRLGVEHNRIKDRLVLYRGRTFEAKTAAEADPLSGSKVIAFPQPRRLHRPAS